MKRINIKPSKTSPQVSFDVTNGSLLLKGRSLLNNAHDFYQPIYTALDEVTNFTKQLNVDFMMDYYNTSSTKCIFQIFKKLGVLKNNDYDVNINWYYQEDDLDHIEIGEDFESILDMRFNFVLNG